MQTRFALIPLALVAGPALAQEGDVASQIAASVDYSSVVSGITTVAIALGVVYVGWKAASLILRAVRGL